MCCHLCCVCAQGLNSLQLAQYADSTLDGSVQDGALTLLVGYFAVLFEISAAKGSGVWTTQLGDCLSVASYSFVVLRLRVHDIASLNVASMCPVS